MYHSDASSLALLIHLRKPRHAVVTVCSAITVGLLCLTAMPSAHAQPAAASSFAVGSSEVRITAGNGFQQLRFGERALAEGDAIAPLGEIRSNDNAALVFSVRQRGSACAGGVIVVSAKVGRTRTI